jgi:hypothetical protein
MMKNGYLVQDSNKTKISYPRNPMKPTRTSLKKKSFKKSLRISWRCY